MFEFIQMGCRLKMDKCGHFCVSIYQGTQLKLLTVLASLMDAACIQKLFFWPWAAAYTRERLQFKKYFLQVTCFAI